MTSSIHEQSRCVGERRYMMSPNAPPVVERMVIEEWLSKPPRKCQLSGLCSVVVRGTLTVAATGRLLYATFLQPLMLKWVIIHAALNQMKSCNNDLDEMMWWSTWRILSGVHSEVTVSSEITGTWSFGHNWITSWVLWWDFSLILPTQITRFWH